MPNFILIGAGGHAKGLVEIIEETGGHIAGYTALETSEWLAAPHLGPDAAPDPDQGQAVLGMGAVDPTGLNRRLALLQDMQKDGYQFPALVSKKAIISPSAVIGSGCQILPGAILHAAVQIGEGSIINSGAIVEHDAQIGSGSHVAPGAILLGNVQIGRACMIGAGAVILPGTVIPDETLIAANTRFGA